MTEVSFPSCHFFPHSLSYVQEIPTIRHKAAVNNSKKKTIDERERECMCVSVCVCNWRKLLSSTHKGSSVWSLEEPLKVLCMSILWSSEKRHQMMFCTQIYSVCIFLSEKVAKKLLFKMYFRCLQQHISVLFNRCLAYVLGKMYKTGKV